MISAKIFVTVEELLERTGAEVDSEDALKIFADGGCWVDGKTVRIPSAKLEWAIRTAPSRITLCNRLGERAILMETENNHFGPGFTAEQIVDWDGKGARAFKDDDFVKVARLCEALREVDFVAPGCACKGPEAFVPLAAHSTKPLILPVANAGEVSAIADMAAEAVGGADKLRRDSYVAVAISCDAARLHSEDAMGAVIAAAKAGVPFIYQTTLVSGKTAPLATAGTIVVALANTLVALTLAQLACEGAPVISGGRFTIVGDGDPIPFAAPEAALISAGFANALRFLRLPSAIYGGISGSAISDAQYGAEATYSLVAATLSGANLILGGGTLEAGRQFSPSCLAMTDETMGQMRRIISGIKIDEDRKAIGVYEDVEPAGYYLDQEHTTTFFKSEQYWPNLINRKRIGDWEAAGSKTMGVRADEYVSSLLGGSDKALMDESALAKIKQILAKSVKA